MVQLLFAVRHADEEARSPRMAGGVAHQPFRFGRRLLRFQHFPQMIDERPIRDDECRERNL